MAPNPFPVSTNIVLLILCLFLSFQSICKPALCGTNATDMQALLAFKSSIVADPLHALKSWNQTVHHCSWRGVMCGHKHSDRVVLIDLTSQGLVGSLSPYIGNLSFLKSMSLGNNSFSSQIPQEIGCLNRLEYLKLSDNSFNGEIPKNISQCRNLYYLGLMNNKLTGRIIPEIGFLDKIRVLGLTINMLSGTIPLWIGNLTYLENLSLSNCGLEGQIPKEIGRLRSLEFIDLSNNSLMGEIPRNISNCRKLVTLALLNNNLTGGIVPEIGSLTRLQVLDLNSNRLSGTIPAWVGNLTSLFWLSLDSCGLKGEIPVSLAHLRNLTFLDLAENKLTGNIPSELFNTSIVFFSVRSNQLQGTIPLDAGYTLPYIRNLDLGDNNLSGEIPISLLNASSLQGINLGSNKFTGPMPNNFESLINLRRIVFSENSIHGDISFISSLTNCTKLQSVSLDANFLSGSLPNSIANLSGELYSLSLGRNNMHGILPSGIGDLVNLTSLVLGYNYFSGPIPSSIGKLIKLQTLVLEANEFTGDIPSSLGNLTLLNRLYLGSNTFTTIPPSFGNLRNLLFSDLSNNSLKDTLPREIFSLYSIYLNLANNALTGPIPREVGSLRNLGLLDLSNNQLSGSIPNAMSSCVSLEYLFLKGNSFEGEIPIGLSALRALQALDLSQNHLAGAIPSFLGEFPLLNYLNLSFNNLSGEVPTSGVFHNKSAISIEGNKDLCGGILELRLPSCPNPKKGSTSSSRLFKIIVPVSVMEVLGLITLFLVCVIVHYKRRERGKSTTPVPSIDGHFMKLSYVDLQKSTGGFSEANLIGAGRFGCVYKGSLDDGKLMVAVKVLNLDVRGASKTLMAECNALKRIRHRNLIKILSVCRSSNFRGQEFKALVYEYKSNGSLEEWLHQNTDDGGRKMRNLTLIQRLNIIIDIASALGYLHFGTDSTIIHGDLKPSNVLLDDDMIAHVGDFGLAKVVMSMSQDLVATEESNSTVAIKGTIGYIAPEYGMGSTGSTQGDVYSFGILILEMLTNIRPTDDTFKSGHSNLHSFVSRALPDGMVDILDPSIVQEIKMSDNHKAGEAMQYALKIGVACSNEFPRDRMAMTEVVVALDRIRSPYLSGN